tara:strand:- start:3108 stop:3635 length:528 start_codon:yes stop_codon:yes gene_type:complete
MKHLIGFAFLLFPFLSFSQDVYPLHPTVGDTIDRDEKLDYSLFANSPNDSFNFSVIKYLNSGFILIKNRAFKGLDGSIKGYSDSTLLTQEQIIEEQQKIQKINAYYKYLAEEAKKPKQEDYKSLENKIPVRFDGPISDQMRKESRMKARLAEDERRMEEFQMGMRPREMRIEFRP